MELKELGLQRINLDLSRNITENFFAKEGDVGTRGLYIKVLNNAVETDTTGITITLFARVGQEVYSVNATVKNALKGEYELIYPTSILKSGIVYAELQLKKLNNIISTKKFKILVESGIVTDSAIEGHDSYPIFEQLLEAGANEITRIANEEIRKANEIERVNAESLRGVRLGELETDFTAHKEEYTNLNIGNRLTNLEEAKIKKYGVRRVIGATTPVLERLGDAVGLVANADTDLTSYNVVRNDFDNIYPWSHMRNCIIEENGRIVYEDEAGYDVAVGDWMKEIPTFYWKKYHDGTMLEEWVSEYQVGGYVKSEKFYVGRFPTSEDELKHVSRPNTFPKVLMNMEQFRDKAREKGEGWQQRDVRGDYILNLLYRVEFAHLNSQLILGNGVTAVRYTEDDLVQLAEDNTNRVVLLTANANNYNVGGSINIGTTRGNMSGGQYRTITAINDLANGTKEIIFDGDPINVLSTYKIYMAGQISGKTLSLQSSSGSAIGINNRSSISYRGVEDLFGNVFEWVDGVLINDNQGYICLDTKKFSNILTDDYVKLGYINANKDGYVGELGYDSNYPFAEFTTDLTGGSTTKYSDYYYQNVGLRAARVGGGFGYGGGVAAGLRAWALYSSPGFSFVDVGSRLLYYTVI